ncbi:hypothetical protein GGG16DRAFT_115502 [Schizophyllum commune]
MAELEDHPHLPQEIIDEIVRLVDLDSDTTSLKSCALAHRSFLDSTQACLFRELSFTSGESHNRPPKTAQILDLLDKSPHIASYVRCVHLLEEPWSLWIADDIALPTLLRRFTNLSGMHASWKESYERCSVLLAALDFVFHLPTFQYFRAADAWNFPPRMLSCMPNLQRLQLTEVYFRSWAIPASSVARHSSLSSIELRLSSISFAQFAEELLDPSCGLDLRNLRHLKTGLMKDKAMLMCFLKIAPILSSIQSLDFALYPEATTGEPTSEPFDFILGAAFPHLRHLTLRSLFLERLFQTTRGRHCFAWLSSQLSHLPLIETLDLHFFVSLRTAEDGAVWDKEWRALDRLLAESAPRLSRVRVHIAHVLDYMSRYQAEENAIARHVRGCLPLLDARGLLHVLSETQPSTTGTVAREV